MAFRKPLPWGLACPPPGSLVDPGDPINQGLVSWWLFNEVGNRLIDSAGRNHGTIANTFTAPTQSKTFGTRPRHFPNNISYIITLPNSDSLNLTGSYTINVWARATAFTNYTNIFYKNGTGGLSGQYGIIVFADGHAEMEGRVAGVGSGLSFGTLTVNKWHMLTCVYDSASSTAYVFKDGVQTNSIGSWSTTSAGTAAVIGGDTTNNRAWSGMIENMRMFNRALRPGEIWRMYSEPFAGIQTFKRNFSDGVVSAATFIPAWARGSTTLVGGGVHAS